jgi:aspartyl protease family protein
MYAMATPRNLPRIIVTAPRLVSRLLAGIAAWAVTATLPFAHGAEVQVIGVFGSKATLVIDGGRPRTLSTGESTPEKIRLISVGADSAVIEADGKRQTLQMGQTGQRISAGQGVGAQRVTLTVDAKGHFFTTATVNGVSMPFMVDTGATMVTINSAHAKNAGIAYTAGERAVVQTANGKAMVYKVKLDTVRVGDITLNNVDGIVMENQQLGIVGLLGMSFLNRTEMQRSGDSMTLTRRY